MTFEEFKSSLEADAPPVPCAPLLRALWLDGRGRWEDAHRVAQDVEGADGAWVHAYLHRKEGDLSNAAYWYRRAGQPVAIDELAVEWERLCRTLLLPSA